MTLLSRWTLAAFALFLFAAPASALEPSKPWPQAASDLTPDPALRFGTLPNGMRYAIRQQHHAPGRACRCVSVSTTGSLMERDDEQGIAHMLEHMAFRGSKHVPDGDMIKTLQSLGLTFGADTTPSPRRRRPSFVRHAQERRGVHRQPA